MKAVYFPFTFVSQQMTDALSACFKSVAVYQPSAVIKTMKNDLTEIRCPVQKDDDRLESLVKDYRKWAEIHQGSELSSFRFRSQDEDTSIARIRSDLKKYGIEQPDEKTDFLFNARLFLRIAQEFDIENQEADQALFAYEKMEKALFDELRGEDGLEIISGKPLVKEEPGSFMTEERLNAWIRLMLEDTEEISDFFVTGSRAVLDLLADKSPELRLNPTPPPTPPRKGEGSSPHSFWEGGWGLGRKT